MAFDKTNTAIAFVDGGIFNKEGVEALGNKPVIVVKANVDGMEKEISLWFAKNKETGDYKVTVKGNKFLTGKVSEPYQEVEYNNKVTTETPKPEFEKDDLPF